MTFWQRIRSWLLRPADRSKSSNPSHPPDPRTMVLPIIGEQNGKTYYEVADMWAREKLGVRRILLGVLDGTEPLSSTHHIAADFQCPFGTWLRMVRVDASQTSSMDAIKQWHAIWHDGVNDIIDHFHAGRYEHPRHMLTQRNSPWHYAARKVDRSLEKLWMERTIDVG